MHSDFSRVKNLFYRLGLFIHCQFEKVTPHLRGGSGPPGFRMAMSEDSIVRLGVDGGQTLSPRGWMSSNGNRNSADGEGIED